MASRSGAVLAALVDVNGMHAGLLGKSFEEAVEPVGIDVAVLHLGGAGQFGDQAFQTALRPPARWSPKWAER